MSKPLEQLLPAGSFVFIDRLQQALALAKSRNVEVYLVGGSARLLAGAAHGSYLRELTDLDILVVNSPDTTVDIGNILRGSVYVASEEASSCAGQKFESHGIKCDVFGNDFKQWLKGAPCYGDMLAINFHTGRWTVTTEFLTQPPYDVNPNGKVEGEKAIGYMKSHRNKLARDLALVENIRKAYNASDEPGSGGPLI